MSFPSPHILLRSCLSPTVLTTDPLQSAASPAPFRVKNLPKVSKKVAFSPKVCSNTLAISLTCSTAVTTYKTACGTTGRWPGGSVQGRQLHCYQAHQALDLTPQTDHQEGVKRRRWETERWRREVASQQQVAARCQTCSALRAAADRRSRSA